MPRQISKKEVCFVAAIIIAVIFITLLPYFYACWNTPKDTYYTGGHSFNIVDRYVYYSYLEQARGGHWLFKELYTSEPQERIQFRPFWLTLGLTARVFHLSNGTVFHLARVILAPIFLILAWFFISYFFQDKLKRKICFLFLAFSSGIGGLVAGQLKNSFYTKLGYAHWPLDLWGPGANTFFTLYHSPQFIASLTLLLSALILMFLAYEKNRLKYSLGAGICALVLFSFHAYHIPTIFSISFVYLLIVLLKERKNLWQYLKHFFVLIVLPLPIFIYHFWLIRSNLVISLKVLQNIALTPAPHLVLVSYGFLIPLALLGIFFIVKRKKPGNFLLFIIVWLIVQSLLIYSPWFPFQRRLTEGLHFPLVILTSIGLVHSWKYLKEKVPKNAFESWASNKVLLIFLFVSLFCFSNIYILAQDFVYFQGNPSSLYISQRKIEAFNWIKKETPEEALILSSPGNGMILPGLTGRGVFLGHWSETICPANKLEITKRFFQDNKNDRWREDFLKKNNINYLFYSQEEKEMGEFDPERKDYLDKVYENDLVTIYKFQFHL